MPEDEKETRRELKERFGSDEGPDSGEGLPWKKIAGIGLAVIIVIGLVWITKPWQSIPSQESSPVGENQPEKGGENQAENQAPEKQSQKTLFKYQASFQYLSSEDNGPIAKGLFLVFPCPTIDNQPVVNTVENSNPAPKLENVTWQLRAHYENNGENWMQIEIENNISGTFVKPRKKAPYIHKPWLGNTSHGPKIWYQFDYGDWNVEKDRASQGAAAFYQNEEAWIQTKFLVPDEKADEVTLANDQGKVYSSMAGYTGDNFKTVNGKFWVKLSKWTGTQFQTVFENNETEWKLYPKLEWQLYRLDT